MGLEVKPWPTTIGRTLNLETKFDTCLTKLMRQLVNIQGLYLPLALVYSLLWNSAEVSTLE